MGHPRALIAKVKQGQALYPAAYALERIGPEAKAAVPALLKALTEVPNPGLYQDQQDREALGKALKVIDPEVARKAGVP